MKQVQLLDIQIKDREPYASFVLDCVNVLGHNRFVTSALNKKLFANFDLLVFVYSERIQIYLS